MGHVATGDVALFRFGRIGLPRKIQAVMGIKEAREQFLYICRQARDGKLNETLMVTYYGDPVLKLVPLKRSEDK